MVKLIMTKGLPGSGKTTWARAQGKKRVNKDDLRDMLDKGVHSSKNEKFILDIRDFIVTVALSEGHDIIVDDTNFAPKHEKRLRELAENNNAVFEVKDFTNVSLEECIKRDAKRDNKVGEKVIRHMYDMYLKKPEEKRVHFKPRPADIPGLPYAIIVDIDGTVARTNFRNPFDWSRVSEDVPRTEILSLVRTIATDCVYTSAFQVIFVSGRDEKCYKDTAAWLNKYFGLSYQLYMRPENDRRRDSIVKREIFDKYIRGKYNVAYIIDDRPQVIRECWQELGYTDLILNVGNGEEF